MKIYLLLPMLFVVYASTAQHVITNYPFEQDVIIGNYDSIDNHIADAFQLVFKHKLNEDKSIQEIKDLLKTNDAEIQALENLVLDSNETTQILADLKIRFPRIETRLTNLELSDLLTSKL